MTLFSGLSGFAQGVNVFKNDVITAVYIAGQPGKYDDVAYQTYRSLGRLKRLVESSEARKKAFAAIVKHYGTRRKQLNPFREGNKYHDAFAVGYSAGYGASFIVPIAAELKAGQVAARLPYVSGLLRSAGTLKSSIKGVAIGSAMWTGGRIARRLPDVTFDVGKRIDKVEGHVPSSSSARLATPRRTGEAGKFLLYDPTIVSSVSPARRGFCEVPNHPVFSCTFSSIAVKLAFKSGACCGT